MSGAVAVTGLGIVSAAGRGLAAVEAALREGRSGLGPLRRFASPRCGAVRVAEVETGVLAAGVPRTVALGEPALEEALAQARLDEAARERVGLCVGCTVGGMPESEEAVAAFLAGAAEPGGVWLRHECGYTTAALARRAGLGGPAVTVSTACSSGAQAIAAGAELIAAGLCDAVVAGGADALCRMTLNGFASLLAIDPDGCRPFDRSRRGMSLGEGAAFLVLEPWAAARARGARPRALLRGWANTCDAHHATAPEPEGRGAEAAMRAALEAAGAVPADVDYVNAHGTGTPDNDRAEGAALRRVFSDRVPPVSSTKRLFGHALAAAGAIEAVVAVLAIERGFLPGNAGCAEPDPACGVVPLAASCAAAPRLVLSNSFGFGGNNTVLCFAAASLERGS